MDKISHKAIHAAYDVARRIHDGKLSNKVGLNILERKYGLNWNSATDYIRNYAHMLKGRRFTRTLNVYGTEYYLEKIFEDGGALQLSSALKALKQHIDYYENLGNGRVHEGRSIYERFLAIVRSEKLQSTTGSRHFFQYWKPKQVDRELAAKSPLLHSGSEQLNRVNPGDIVWIVTIRPPGHLHLVGPIRVGEVVTYEEAKKRFAENVWQATYHVIAERDTEKPIREMSLMSIAGDLRFSSSNNRDRLTLVGGRVDGKQLQSIRRLTAESANLLEKLWPLNKGGAEAKKMAAEFERQVRRGAGFGDFVENKKVESSAIKYVTQNYCSRGWTVRSVDPDKCGFDLLCKKGAIEKHVEVKGVRGGEVSFIITRGEIKRAKTDSDFVLCVVTSALTNQPKLWSYGAREFLRMFIFDPLAYRSARIRESRSGLPWHVLVQFV